MQEAGLGVRGVGQTPQGNSPFALQPKWGLVLNLLKVSLPSLLQRFLHFLRAVDPFK